jgi:hypothetical protein
VVPRESKCSRANYFPNTGSPNENAAAVRRPACCCALLGRFDEAVRLLELVAKLGDADHVRELD